MSSPRPRHAALACLVGVVALLPFARGLFAGHAFYFRDLSHHFFPVRLFLLEGLRQGEWRSWNPFTHEGEPVSLPLGYPVDLAALLWPSEAGLSLLLALHVPLAALTLMALARELRAPDAGAVAGGLVYALGGFALSTLNLYVYAQALAWAPLVVLGLMRAAAGGRREIALAALPLGLAATTTGVEIVAQAIAAGLLLAPKAAKAWPRMALVLALGLGLAAFVLLPLGALVGESARGEGLATEVVLAHSVHPITLVQTVVAGLYGDPARVSELYWGQNFFPLGFPYILSLYLGATALCLAFLGLVERPRPGRLLAGLAALGLLASLGRYAGLAPLVEAAGFLRSLRYPVKAFFSLHLCVSLLAALGLGALGSAPGTSRPWKRLGRAAGAAGALLLLFGAVVCVQGPLHRYLLAGFFPPHLDAAARETNARLVAADAGAGGALAALVGLLAFLAARARLGPGIAAPLVTATLAADLLRAGAGLNPMASPAFYRLTPDAERMAADIRASGGRLYALDPGYSRAYYEARARRGASHESWSFEVLRESFVPEFNLAPRVPTALSLDRTMLVPTDRILRPGDAGPEALPRLLERLREGAVTRVLSLEPLTLPDLEPVATGDPTRLAPLRTRLYRLKDSRPRFALTNGAHLIDVQERSDALEIRASSPSVARLAMRDAFAAGWTATVNGTPVMVESYAGRYRSLSLPAGESRVTLRYRPPRRHLGVLVSLGAAAACALLLRPPKR